MTQPEYIAALLSIIVGLGLTDLARSLRELVRPQRKVNWHWIPLLWAANTLFLAVQIWWNSFSLIKEATSKFFFPFFAAFLLLYLACAFALPDPEWEESQSEVSMSDSRVSIETLGSQSPLDLKAFYFSEVHRRWFFGILVGFLVASQVGIQGVRALAENFSVSWLGMLLNGVAVVLVGALGLTDRWWVHAPLTVFSFLYLARTAMIFVFIA